MTASDPTASVQGRPNPLLSTLALLERESARRAKGTHAGMMRLDDAELRALLELLRREVGNPHVNYGAVDILHRVAAAAPASDEVAP